MIQLKEKKERALGVKLGLKPERCLSPKCAAVRKPYRPGAHGKARRRSISELGEQLLEKQKLQYSYGLREAQMRRIFSAAARHPGRTAQVIIGTLEGRLDNAVYRLGLAPSRSVARQLVGHGHITVRGRRVTVPSAQVRPGDLITIHPASRGLVIFQDLPLKLKKYEPPVWLTLDKEKLEGTVIALPEHFDLPFDINMVVDYYNK